MVWIAAGGLFLFVTHQPARGDLIACLEAVQVYAARPTGRAQLCGVRSGALPFVHEHGQLASEHVVYRQSDMPRRRHAVLDGRPLAERIGIIRYLDLPGGDSIRGLRRQGRGAVFGDEKVAFAPGVQRIHTQNHPVGPEAADHVHVSRSPYRQRFNIIPRVTGGLQMERPHKMAAFVVVRHEAVTTLGFFLR